MTRRTNQNCLGVLAVRTENKLLDEPIEQLLQSIAIMSAVHNVAFALRIHLCLSTQLTPKILARIYDNIKIA